MKLLNQISMSAVSAGNTSADGEYDTGGRPDDKSGSPFDGLDVTVTFNLGLVEIECKR
jgi:hypothetical protein